MTRAEIYTVQSELNHLVREGNKFSDLYELSVKLDKLILKYYREQQEKCLN